MSSTAAGFFLSPCIVAVSPICERKRACVIVTTQNHETQIRAKKGTRVHITTYRCDIPTTYLITSACGWKLFFLELYRFFCQGTQKVQISVPDTFLKTNVGKSHGFKVCIDLLFKHKDLNTQLKDLTSLK